MHASLTGCLYVLFSVHIPVGHRPTHLIQVDPQVEAHLVQGKVYTDQPPSDFQ